MIDGDEVFVGTSATDPGSVFTADLTRPGGGQLTVSFQTIPARLYAVQQTVDPLSAPWAAAPGVGSIVGDGTLTQVPVDETSDRHDFRVAVRQQEFSPDVSSDSKSFCFRAYSLFLSPCLRVSISGNRWSENVGY